MLTAEIRRVDMPEIARRFVDSPVLIGHDKGGLPMPVISGRNGGKRRRLWIKSYFYWLKQSENAERLALNIDAGIYKECSVSFIYDTPECSACGQDIRTCGHQVSRDIHFYYRGVEKILETSLVYRGAIPGMSITDQLAIDKPNSGVFRLIPAASGQFGLASEPNSKTVAARLGGRRFYLVMQE
jgi:hypothetical protein